MNKKSLTEADIRTKFVTPALVGPNGDKWNVMTQIREEVYFTRGCVIVRGKTVKRGEAKKADYILPYKPNLPLAVLEAKHNHHAVSAGMQQALGYPEVLDVPFDHEHPYPPGAKSYNKGKPIRIEEFEGECAWWGEEKDGFRSRVENEQAWRVSLDTIKAGNFNLDLKNPHNADTGPGDVDHLLPEYEKLLAGIAETRGQLKAQLMEALTR